MRLMALGPHIFRVVGLNGQEIESGSEAVWAEFGRFGMVDGAQFHGHKRPTLSIRGTLFPDAIGGLPDYEGIRASQFAGRALPMLRMGRGFTARVLGMVTIDRVTDLETYGGKKVAFGLELKGYTR